MKGLLLSEDLPPRPELTDDHIAMIYKYAIAAKFSYPWRDIEDSAHEGLYALFRAWMNWTGEGTFEAYASKSVRLAIKYSALRHNNTHLSRQLSIEFNYSPNYSDFSDTQPTETELADTLDLEALVAAKIDLSRILKILDAEPIMIREIVLKTEPDAELALRWNMPVDQIRRTRMSYLLNYRKTLDEGVPLPKRRNTGPGISRKRSKTLCPKCQRAYDPAYRCRNCGWLDECCE